MTNARWVLWRLPLGLVIVGLLLPPMVRMWLWTLSFGLAGIACIANASRCHRTHCYFSGPVYLIAGVFSMLAGLGWFSLSSTWIVVGAFVGVVLAYQVERVRGRYAKELGHKGARLRGGLD